MTEQANVMMIIGASKGLGRQLALHFSQKGYRLVLVARGEKNLKAVGEEIQLRSGKEPLVLQGDMSQEEDVERIVSVALAHYHRIDVLINNASVFGPGPSVLLDYPTDSFSDVLLTNVVGPFLMTRQVLPTMLAQGSGVVLTVTSEAGQTGFAEWGAYGISKFAVEGMIQTWADELEESGVRMHLIDPGEMDTEMHAIAVPDCDYPLARPADAIPLFERALHLEKSPLRIAASEEESE
ncbi:SDR family NAD(P)-dependent oxidoreductase [Aureibacillus halotolerans]|uniref:Short-subunit dehydrogenase n=1 Tax=Aureibacillus halotolerans TaxID=1508390 RepID=A0A4R6UAA5_9BACI|nr:SDR family oxidoreductase [Aureibacillus halotolerans]TDQ42776.1 short-subunit dehydrogenase [Aureibacillus halotolerans]